MGETANIAAISNLVSSNLFESLNWVKRGPLDIQWPCEKPETHKISTKPASKDTPQSHSHPTDVVYKYMDPYEGENFYYQFDLKSYAKGSITPSKLRPAIISLSKQIACASISPDWQDHYLDEGDSAIVHGILFVYNHDGEYDKDFKEIAQNTRSNQLVHPRGSRIFLIGPEDIFWGTNIVDHIQRIRGKNGFNGGPIRFFLPQLARKTLRSYSEIGPALPIESLLSDHVTITYTDTTTNQNFYKVFYRGSCSTSEEFVFLLNYLIQYQVINGLNNIEIVGIGVPDNAIQQFHKAQNYLVDFLNDHRNDTHSDLSKILGDVKFNSANKVVTEFSSIEIGFNRG